MKRLGFIGFGEATLSFINGIQETKDLEFIVYDVNFNKALLSKSQVKFPESIELCDSISTVIRGGEIIIVAVPGKYDYSVFQTIEKEQLTGKIFFDICTAPPQIKEGISKIVEDKNGIYIDAAVMGSIPTLKNKVPIYASGLKCGNVIDELQDFGFNIKDVGVKPGIASKIKLCRSIYMKGLAALSIELKTVSDAFEVTTEVFNSIAESMDKDNFYNYTQRLIEGTYKHCVRRKDEVEECLDLFKSKGLSDYMTRATYMLYDDICKNQVVKNGKL